jgi:hypothetical protein
MDIIPVCRVRRRVTNLTRIRVSPKEKEVDSFGQDFGAI